MNVGRLVPFLCGAALAIVLDSGLKALKTPAAAAQADSKSEAITAVTAVTAVAAVPAQRPGVVPREEPPPVQEATPVQETRPVLVRRPPAPMPNSKDVDAALARALDRRGLETTDLDRVDSLKAAVAKLHTARAGNDGRDVETALAQLLPAIERAPLSHDLVSQKLEQVRRALTQSEAAIEKQRFEFLQQRYLDAKLELSRTEAAQLGPFAVKVAQLLKDIRAARGP